MRSLQRDKIWKKILTMKFVGDYETPSGGNGQETIGIRYMTKPLYLRPLLVSIHFRIMEFLSKMRY